MLEGIDTASGKNDTRKTSTHCSHLGVVIYLEHL
jgi:hypothetical protein